MDVHMKRAMAHLLHDLEVAGAPVPQIEASRWQNVPGAQSAVLRAEDNASMGVWIDTRMSEGEQTAMLADQVQDWVVEELCRVRQATNWPQCPEHPNNHPLVAGVENGRAIWTCSKSGLSVCEIGRLAPPVACRSWSSNREPSLGSAENT